MLVPIQRPPRSGLSGASAADERLIWQPLRGRAGGELGGLWNGGPGKRTLQRGTAP